MVERRKSNTKKKRNSKESKKNGTKARKVNASTVYETCTERLRPFGGLLALIKFLDLVKKESDLPAAQNASVKRSLRSAALWA